MALASYSPSLTDNTMLKIAREIAMDIRPLEDILKTWDLSSEAWSKLASNPTFNRLVASETEAWQSAGNTPERVKHKSAVMLEEWLPELYMRLHDNSENLNAKLEGGKLLAKLAGVGERGPNEAGPSEKFTITINMGDQGPPIEFSKDVTPKVIDHDGSNFGGSE